MLTTLLMLGAALAPQDPQPDSTRVVLRPDAFEAPEQLRTRSRGTYRRRPRLQFDQPTGGTGTVRVKIRDLVRVRGNETNPVSGFGVVTGLQGTGDSAELAKQLLANVFSEYGAPVPMGSLSTKNIAVVWVEGEIPAGMAPGLPIKVRVSTLGDAKSLVGGTLMQTELFDLEFKRVYATAHGNLLVGGIAAEGEAASVTKNHPTVATAGGTIQRQVPTQLVSEQGLVHLDLKPGQDTLSNVVAISDAVNGLFPQHATPTADGKSVKVMMPAGLTVDDHMRFIDALERLEVDSENLARISINERNGVVVISGDVRLKPGAVAHGALTVTIAESAQASQPAPFSAGTTERQSRTSASVTEDDNGLVLVPETTTLQDVVDVLNVMGATPRDLMVILTEMSENGLLVGDIVMR